MQGLGFAIVGALERLFKRGVFAVGDAVERSELKRLAYAADIAKLNAHERPPKHLRRQFYQQMFNDYGVISIEAFTAKYGDDWYNIHGKGLRSIIDDRRRSKIG